MEKNCTNCNEVITGNFCVDCGYPVKLHKIDKHYIAHEISHALHFEKGFFYSAKELLIRPGESIKEFIYQNRNKHMKPAGFLLLSSLFYTLIAHVFHVDEIYNQMIKVSAKTGSINAIMSWVYSHWGYTNLFVGVFTALCLKLLFRKYDYNFFELVIMLCFIMGEGMLLIAAITLFFPLLGTSAYLIISSIISYGYIIWAIPQFYDGSKILNYIKAFFAYFFGLILFFMAIIPIGLIADLFIKIFN
ncbi:hypothetical protein A5893_10630 [Pedobacter psychrophilus]|uniref:DUF3667 domain-containing protein n=1 Tax=Pedobacter psychrophilus TaxID=1826909 RepID=A0A179DDI8_9SPHI|nr:DUF3667 domain-containing protein [Pedobacter psychrophilus]OAQ39117.1 hypothetical protein A5893_10630 [Pedobacter psychrophilus]